MLSTIRTRFLRDEIYTAVSKIIIAMNPFKSLKIYTAKYCDLSAWQLGGRRALE